MIKKLLTINSLLIIFTCFSQSITFADANFKAKLLESSTSNLIATDVNGKSIKIDQNNNNEIEVSEAEAVVTLSLNNRRLGREDFVTYFFREEYVSDPPANNISSLDGIKYFKNLKSLDCSSGQLTTIDFENLNNLELLYCNKNKIASFVNFDVVKKLLYLDCSDNLLTSIDLSQSSVLAERHYTLFKLRNNNFQAINLQNNKTTAYMILASWEDCPFFYDNMGTNSCTYLPKLQGNPNLTSLKVNCADKGFYKQDYPFAVDNCDLISTNEVSKNSFKIYPNPAKDVLTIESTSNIEKIEIFDASSKLVFNEIVKNPTIKARISLDKLLPGVYQIVIKSKSGTSSQKIIKE
ncbi:T9SS type A sorting domain-containing protein [Soonwooa sp.]|uniref:T9SS type A sorting domain-containing protein n=1 Tax=Soonwooa sp. TaxID=1938592 RepID=UPI00261EF777|nr:T9SS type A sorting domain-containing protein [Soonwooa sp.]